MSQYRAYVDSWYLDSETINKRVDTFGNKVMIIGSSAESVTIYVEAKGSNLQGTGSLPLQNRDWFATPIIFEQLALTWSAQPGQWIDVLILILDPAPVQFEYVRQQRGTIDSIANTVNVKETPSSAFTTNQFTVTTAAVKIADANPARKSLLIKNDSTSLPLYLVGTNVTANGHVMWGGEALEIKTTAEVWAYRASGSANVTVLAE